MNVTLRSDNDPDVVLFASNEICRLRALDQHIRTMQAARRWLAAEMRRKKPREEAAAEVKPT